MLSRQLHLPILLYMWGPLPALQLQVVKATAPSGHVIFSFMGVSSATAAHVAVRLAGSLCSSMLWVHFG